MRRRKYENRISCFRVFVAVVSFSAVCRAAEPDVTVRTSLDRTAMWVADRVAYMIEITCRRGIDVLADDLSRDKLKLEGLEVVDADTERRSAAGGTTVYRFRYILTTYRVDVPTLKIAPLAVRYAVIRTGQRLEEAAPAGEVHVPGAAIAFRSVLPDEPDPSGVRSDKPPIARPMRFGVLQPIGIGLIIVSIVPALVALVGLVRRRSRSHVRRSARAVRQNERISLETVRAMEIDTIEGRRAVLTQVDALVRGHLREVYGVPGASLTPQEVPFALATRRTTVPAEVVASVLATCELGRYGPPHMVPSPDACRDAVEKVEQIVLRS